MFKIHLKSQSLCFAFFLAYPASAVLPLSWQNILSQPANLYTTQTIYAMNGSKRYSYAPYTLYDVNTFTGTFSCSDPQASAQWIASPDPQFLFALTDPYVTTHAPASWCWRSGNNEWKFDALTLHWSSQEKVTEWRSATFNEWINDTTQARWVRYENMWVHFFSDGQDNEIWTHEPFTQTWNNTLPQAWTLDESTMIWSCEQNRWKYNPIRETLSCISEGAPQNSWRFLGNGMWMEEFTGVTWRYAHKHWQNTQSSDPATYALEAPFFPPILPPPVVWQYTAIYDLHQEIATTILPVSEPEGEYLWADENTIVRIHTDRSIDVALPSLSARAGRGSRYGYQPSSFFETTQGERWLLQTYQGDWHDIFFGDSQIAQFTNMTNLEDIAHGDMVQLYPFPLYGRFIYGKLGGWARVFMQGTSAWFYNVAQNNFSSSVLDVPYTFNLATLSWKNESTQQEWRYTPEDSLFLWRNITTGENWDFSIIDKQPGGLLAHAEFSSPAYGTFVPQQDNVYLYTNLSGTQTSVLASDFPTIFQLIPPNIVGFASALTHIGYNDTTSHSPLSETQGIFNRMRETKEAADALLTPFDTITHSFEGAQLYSNLLPILTNILSVRYKNKWLMNEFDRLVNAYMSMSTTVVCYNQDFPVWADTQMSFETTGRGGFDFSTQPTSSESLAQGFLIGFAPEIPDDQQATYLFHLSGIMSYVEGDPYPYHTTYTVKRLENDKTTIVAEQSLVVKAENSYFNPCQYTCIVDSGRIQIGVTSDANLQTSKIIFDHTIIDGVHPFLIRYYSFANAPGFDGYTNNTFQYIFLGKRYTYDLYSTQFKIVDLIAQCRDHHRLSSYDNTFTTVKNKFKSLVSASSYASRRTIMESLLGAGIQSNLISPFQTLKHAACSQTSLPFFDYYLSTAQYISNASAAYYNYLDKLDGFEESLSDLLHADTPELSLEQKETLIDTLHESIAQLTASNNLTVLRHALDQGDAALHEQKNATLIPVQNFLKEELCIAQNLTAGLEETNPAILTLFTQKTGLSNNLLIPVAEGSQSAVLSSFARAVSERASTPYAALVAFFILFSISPFDEIRRQVDAYLTTASLSSFHTLPTQNSPLTNPQICFDTLQEICNALLPPLNAQKSSAFLPFSGTVQTPNPPTRLSYIASSVSQPAQDLAGQQQSIYSGSAECLNNTSLQSSLSTTTLTTLREILGSAGSKTNEFSRVYVKDAILALGNGNYTSQSGNALSLFGNSEISPEGNTLITLSSDIVIAGSSFLKPSTAFGTDSLDPSRCLPTTPQEERGTHEIIFTSPVERTITVTSGTDLDLTAFGQAVGAGSQRIVFAGNVKLIFEPNTKLRLPYTSPYDPTKRLTLAFRDTAQLIFQGNQNRELSPFQDATAPDILRTKILGCGCLEFSHQSSASLFGTALVSVEADYTSNVTSIEIRLKDNSSWNIGDQHNRGGGFQVGNSFSGGNNTLDPGHYPNSTAHPFFGSSQNPFTPHKTNVDFTLTLEGTAPLFCVGAGGFFGLGVGTIQKEGIINGTASMPPWALQPLSNMGSVTFNFLGGTFWHHQVADGESERASLLAFGPQVAHARYTLTLDKKNNTLIQGGGNVLLLRASAQTPFPVALTRTVAPLRGNRNDNGVHSLLAPAPLIKLRQTRQDATNALFKYYNDAIITETPTTYQLSGLLDDFYKALTFQTLALNNKFVVATSDSFSHTITYVDSAGEIVTTPIKTRNVQSQSSQKVTPQTIAPAGYLRSLTQNPQTRRFVRPRT